MVFENARTSDPANPAAPAGPAPQKPGAKGAQNARTAAPGGANPKTGLTDVSAALGTVSYTHLDVYKRQVHSCPDCAGRRRADPDFSGQVSHRILTDNMVKYRSHLSKVYEDIILELSLIHIS